MSEYGERIGLVGCVKSKSPTPAPAKDVYRSPLFAGRRRSVEMTCDRWWILSALHGLLDPETVIDSYNRTLTAIPTAARRAWADEVLGQLDKAGVLDNVAVAELHLRPRVPRSGPRRRFD